MASYLSVNNYSHDGNLFISNNAIVNIAIFALKKMDVVQLNKRKSHRTSTFNINDKINCYIRDGKAVINVNVDILKGHNVNDVCLNIQKNIADDLEAMIEQIPFSIKVRVDHII